MDRIKLNFELPQERVIFYGSQEINVIPFLTTAQQVFIINEYLKDLYHSAPENNPLESLDANYLVAEFNLRNYILQTITNIDVENMDSNFYSDSALWDEITNSVANYWDFHDRLEIAVRHKSEQMDREASIGAILKSLSGKFYEILETLSDIDPDKIDKIKESTLDIIRRMEESSVLKNVSEDLDKLKVGR